MSLIRILLLSCIATLAYASEPLPTVPALDLQRYQGQWYEIARLDHWFQRGCTQSSAEYQLRDDGAVAVTNRCVTAKGKAKQAEGVAKPVAGRPAQLGVSFGLISSWFVPSDGNYWVIALDDDYQWVMVGHPNRKYLWLLSRTPELPAGIREQLTARADELGFPVDALRWETAKPE